MSRAETQTWNSHACSSCRVLRRRLKAYPCTRHLKHQGRCVIRRLGGGCIRQVCVAQTTHFLMMTLEHHSRACNAIRNCCCDVFESSRRPSIWLNNTLSATKHTCCNPLRQFLRIVISKTSSRRFLAYLSFPPLGGGACSFVACLVV